MAMEALLAGLGEASQVAGLAGGASNTIMDTLQKGTNLVKDWFNVDTERSKEAQSELMYYQYLYNVLQQSYANLFNVASQKRQHQMNLESMLKQYGYNYSLNNIGRSVLEARASGLNPAEKVSQSAGSVSSQPASSPQLSGLPVAGVGGIPGSHYSPGNVLAASEASLMNSQSNKNNAEAQSTRVKLQTQLQEQILSLKNMLADIEVKTANKEYLSADAKRIKESLNSYIANLEAQAEYYSKSGAAAEKTAAVAEENVRVRWAELTEEQRHNKVMEAVSQVQNTLSQQKINIDAQLLTPTITKMYAEADKLTEEHLTIAQTRKKLLNKFDKEIDELVARAAKERSDIDLNDAQIARLGVQIVTDVTDEIVTLKSRNPKPVKGFGMK